jgi:hypothetical protein
MPAGHGSANGTPPQPRHDVPLPPQTPHQSYWVGGRVRVGGNPSHPRQVEPLPPQTPHTSIGRVQTVQASPRHFGQVVPSPQTTLQGSIHLAPPGWPSQPRHEDPSPLQCPQASMVLQLVGVGDGSLTLSGMHEHPSGATISSERQVTSQRIHPHWVLSTCHPERHEGAGHDAQPHRSSVGRDPGGQTGGGSQISEQVVVAHGVQHSVGERYWPWGQEVGQGAHLQPTVS